MKLVPRSEWKARPPRRRSSKLLSSASTGHWNGPVLKVAGQTTWDHVNCAALVRGIQNFHMDGHGWGDIAYNFVECPHGYTFEGRGLNVINAANGTNAANNTSHAIMCLAGEGNVFPDEEKIGFRETVAYIAEKTKAPDACVGHRDHKSTQCPGDERYSWIRAGMPLTSEPVPPVPPVPPISDSTEKSRIMNLQVIVGTIPDGIWGPKTESAISKNLIGWNKNLPGNNNSSLVKFLQRQGNRKFNNNMAEDGLLGPVTNHLIVVQLGQTDGIAGPKAWRFAVA